MINHFHLAASFATKSAMSAFMNEVTNVFARKYNRHYGLKGQLFRRPFGSASKSDLKKFRQMILYIGNNAKEKKAVIQSEKYRWNFLKYMEESHPFSEKIEPQNISKDLTSLLKTVKKMRKQGKCIDYRFFDSNKYTRLTEIEKRYIIDSIITEYSNIDNNAVISAFGSIQKLYDMLDMTSESEYGLPDDYEQEDYRHYYKMIKIAISEGYDINKVRFHGIGESQFELHPDIAKRIINRAMNEANASRREISKFLHC